MFLNKWNLLNVTNMGSMFSDCLIFNNGDTTNAGTKPLTFTTSSALTSVSSMFLRCHKFNQTVSITNMEKVRTFELMFQGCVIFNNGDITNAGTKPLTFTTSNALTTAFAMFGSCTLFNQRVVITNMEKVTTMFRMFSWCRIFNNGDTGNNGNKPLTFTTSASLNNIFEVFVDCRLFNQTVVISNVTKVINMGAVFRECLIFNNGDITDAGTKPLSFTTSTALTSLSSMFLSCFKFNQTVSFTNMANVINMDSMFSGCSIFNNGDITDAGTKPLTFTTSSALTTIASMFLSCVKFNQTVSITNMANISIMECMFQKCSIFNNGNITDAGTKPLSFTTSSVLINIQFLFIECAKFNQTVTFSNMSNVWIIQFMFSGCSIFNNGSTLNDGLNPITFATSINITYFPCIFRFCYKFNQTVSISNNNILKVFSIEQMFSGCSIFNNGDITDAGTKPLTFTTSSDLKTIESMFMNCFAFNQRVSITNVEKVTGMDFMFSGCSIFNNGDVGNYGTKPLTFTTSSVLTSLNQMCYNCAKFNQTVSMTNMSGLTNMLSTFNGCSIFNNGDITDARTKPLLFTTSSTLNNLGYLFSGCASLNQEVSISNVSAVTNMVGIFQFCSLFNNGYSITDNTHKLFSTKPNNITNTSYFGHLSPLANTTSNRPNWLTTSWNLI
jgi:hypothetical protein